MKLFLFFSSVCLSLSAMAQLQPIPSGVYHWSSLTVNKGTDREGRRIMEGTSPQLEYLEIHATTQQKGAVPRPPHAQKDIEELIIVTGGKMRFTIGKESRELGKGSVILIPPLEMQSVENIGDGPLTYYVMMFRSKKPMDMGRSVNAGGALFLNADSLRFKPSERGGTVPYFDRPTAMCERFEMHITELSRKGPSHAPHSHVETEIILVLEGDTEMKIGDKTYTASAGDLYIMNSGELHGISNATDTPCRYFAFKWK